MELFLSRHLWGVTDPLETTLPRFKAFGYKGIEAAMLDLEAWPALSQTIQQHGLEVIPLLLLEGDTPAEHLRDLEQKLELATQSQPSFVTCHAGRDAFSEAESHRFFEQALVLEQRLGIPIAYETHRSRILFNPWIASRLLTAFPDLKLCCDFSHWVVVGERLLDDEAILRQCAEACLHLHARVGYEQGPQVPDPRAPEYAPHLQAHLRWWAQVWQAQAHKGLLRSTLTPEYGPPPYLHTLPHTDAPVANLEQICDWQARRAAEHFEQLQTLGKV